MIDLRPWSEDDFPLLIETNAPEMTRYLGGPESDEKLRERLTAERYAALALST